MRWYVFCSALAFAEMVATVDVSGLSTTRPDTENAWQEVAHTMPAPVARAMRIPDGRVRGTASTLSVTLASVVAQLPVPPQAAHAGLAVGTAVFFQRELSQGQTSRGPPAI